MNHQLFYPLLALTWALPLVSFLWLGVFSLLGVKFRESIVCSLVRTTNVLGIILTGFLMFLHRHVFTPLTLPSHEAPLILPWIRTPLLNYDIVLGADLYSFGYVLWSFVITGVIGRFSSVYLKGVVGLQKFMMLLLLLQWGVVTVVLAARLDLLMLGWEVVGVASVLLIGFIQDGKFAGSGSLTAFASYKVSDIGLLTAGVLLHHIPQLAVPFFHGIQPSLPLVMPRGVESGSLGLLLGFALIFGSLAKGSQWPFVAWLPRAMEGPTPSSAAFYGALSVHLGPLLLLKLRPFWAWSPWLIGLVIAIGLVTVIYGSFVGKTVSNYKAQLAYGIMVQLGLIYIEVALGFEVLAMWHIWGHGTLRTLQFLRAGSVMSDFALNPVFFKKRTIQGLVETSKTPSVGVKWSPLRPVHGVSFGSHAMYVLAWNEFLVPALGQMLRNYVGLYLLRWERWQGKSNLFFAVVAGMMGLSFYFRFSGPIEVDAVQLLAIGTLLLSFQSRNLGHRIKAAALAHVAIVFALVETHVFSHSKLLISNTGLMFCLLAVLFKMGQSILRQLPGDASIEDSMGLALIFPKQSAVFLAAFLILGISPGSLLFLAEDLLLEHLVEIGLVPMMLFLELGLILAVFLYRTYVQVFMGYQMRWDGITVSEDKVLIWLGRLAILFSVLISIVPQK